MISSQARYDHFDMLPLRRPTAAQAGENGLISKYCSLRKERSQGIPGKNYIPFWERGEKDKKNYRKKHKIVTGKGYYKVSVEAKGRRETGSGALARSKP